jgi:hypothetical protein
MILSNKNLNINKLEEIYKQKKIEENIGLNTHNQGVTGSSPVGPTPLIASLPEDGGLSYFRHQYNMCTTNS